MYLLLPSSRYYAELYPDNQTINLNDSTQLNQCKKFVQQVIETKANNPNISEDEICNLVVGEWKRVRNENNPDPRRGGRRRNN